ncbi:hypothetical protein BEL04_14565 [Mucilaginibacter sp. PPCGB 2223]|uniref:hypothetical protein n=1 Tax=Mucilaginibacter sp. PPCGB 2223 TaxID=1886027 RepID=UPI000825EFE0|nr:hypothetical protein [Mucilaginibacter sp. PPCGB 2223]OCX52666.1 hypothetical protein BEL04_14565 [Mucilaginibacter sp. PPCGB 2223]
MKKSFLLIAVFLCLATLTRAQTADEPAVDYCKQISRDTDAAAGKHTYESPFDKMIIKSVVTSAGQTITINFNTHQMELSEEAGLYIKFTDGKALRFFGQKIDHKYENSVTGYNYETTLIVSPEKLEYFKTKKVAIFQIANIDVEVNDDTATQFQAYANCIANLK